MGDGFSTSLRSPVDIDTTTGHTTSKAFNNIQGFRPAHTAMYWMLEDGRRKMGRPKKTWRSTFKDLEEMCVSRHVPAGSPVTVRDGDFLFPDAPRGTK